MKKSILLLAFAVSVSLGFSQKITESEVPGPVKGALNKQYPNATNVKWDKENSAYEASFDSNKTDTSILFDGTGKIIETEVEIQMNQLPKGVSEYVNAHYKGSTIREAAMITDANGVVTYEAAIKGMDLIFDASGKFLKEVKD
jgi:hypothetical protein